MEAFRSSRVAPGRARIEGWLLLLALALSLPAAAMDDGKFRFYAYAYDLKTNKYLYTEVHEQNVVNGKWIGGIISYYAADGSSLGRKTLDFSKDEFVPVYRLDLTQEGYMEGITGNGEKIEMTRQSGPREDIETATVKRDGLMVADSGFHSFLSAHFAELMSGQTLRFRFAVAGNLDSFKFKGKRIADTTFEGKPAVRFLVELDSLLNLLGGPLEVTYDPEKRKLLEYRGVSNVHDPRSGKAYDVRIAYYSTPPADAPKLPPLQ